MLESKSELKRKQRQNEEMLLHLGVSPSLSSVKLEAVLSTKRKVLIQKLPER